MLEHIVKNGESIHDILNMYHLELEEIKGVNLHITDFFNIQTGMKIKIPLINNEIEQILENTESFVQKYYPKVNDLYEDKIKVESPRIQVRPEEKVEEKKILPAETPPKGKPYPGILPPKRNIR